jgi:hypothetical protein
MTENEEETKPRLFGVRDLSLNTTHSSSSRLLPLNTLASQYPEGSRFPIPDHRNRVSGSANPLYSPAARALAQSIVFFPCSGQAAARAGRRRFFFQKTGRVDTGQYLGKCPANK